MKVLTEKDLLEYFQNQSNKANKTISLKTRSKLKTNKYSRNTDKTIFETFGTESITKESENVVQINTIYENSVNNRLEKAGEETDFKDKEPTWGKFVEGSRCLREHKGKFYLRAYQTNSRLGKESRYLKENGEELSEKDVKILKEEFLAIKPEVIKSQGLSYQESCKPTDYAFESLLEIVMDGDEIVVERA